MGQDIGHGMVRPYKDRVLLERTDGEFNTAGLWMPLAKSVDTPILRVVKGSGDGFKEGDLVYAKRAVYGDNPVPRVWVRRSDILAVAEST